MENVKERIVELETEYWQAITDKDFETALRLTSDPALVTGAQGHAALDHKTFRSMMNDSTWELHEFSMDNVEVAEVAPDVAVIAYQVTEEMTVEGKPLTMVAADASTWVRRGDDWVCVLHTESILGDPFGRDKKQASSGNGKQVAKKKPSAAARKRPAASRRRKVRG